jgi:hypothetical protein
MHFAEMIDIVAILQQTVLDVFHLFFIPHQIVNHRNQLIKNCFKILQNTLSKYDTKYNLQFYLDELQSMMNKDLTENLSTSSELIPRFDHWITKVSSIIGPFVFERLKNISTPAEVAKTQQEVWIACVRFNKDSLPTSLHGYTPESYELACDQLLSRRLKSSLIQNKKDTRNKQSPTDYIWNLFFRESFHQQVR